MRSALVLAGPEDPIPTGDTESSLRRVAESVAPLVEDLVVACTDDQRSAVTTALGTVPHRLAVDPTVEEGAVAAIRTGARVATGDSVAVVAAHVPTVDASLLEGCFEARETVETGETAAVPHSDGWLHPLHAVYETAAVRRACDRTLATGSRRFADVLARIDDVTVVDAPDLECGDESTDARGPDATTPVSVVGS